LKLTRYQRFAAVLSDIGLPDGNGYELMAILQAQYNMPCISMTAFDELDGPPGQRNLQLTAHLTKPLHIQDIDTVVELLKSVIARPAPIKVGA
jgi:DNA-binding NtrC family response regulator